MAKDRDAPDEIRIPVVEERLVVAKRRTRKGAIRIRLRTVEQPHAWDIQTATGDAEVERVPVGRVVEAVPPVRQEGDHWVIPIVDETPVIVKRLYLREELHVKMHRSVERRGGEIVLRQLIADIERLDDFGDAPEDIEETSVTRKITAVFETLSAAERAREQLAGVGVAPASVSIIHAGDSLAPEERQRQRGWFSTLFGRNEDRAAYEESLRRGDYLLSAIVDERRADEAIRVLDRSDAVDFDKRTEGFRQSGWRQGGDDRSDRKEMRGEVLAEANADRRDDDDVDRRAAGDWVGPEPGARDAALSSGAIRDQDTAAFPVVEEQVAIGKREVERGGVRVRSYVVETPVEELVTLREQYVDVERRPVGETLAPGDVEAAFRDRDITITERREEPVVAKQAVVKEEVIVSKREAERTETVRDTARRTEVEVDKSGRGDSVPPGGKTGGGQSTT